MNQIVEEKKVSKTTDKVNDVVISSPTQEQFQNDVMYHCAIFQVKKLLQNHLITIDEYHQMEQEIRLELCPYLYELYPA